MTKQNVLILIAIAGLAFLSLAPSSGFLVGGIRDEFPGRRQGGGTHWTPPHLVN